MERKYYKDKHSDRVVEWISHSHYLHFKGKVVIPNSDCKAGQILDSFSIDSFEPCEAPQLTEATQPEQFPTKDTELRRERLKLAVSTSRSTSINSETVLSFTQDLFDSVCQHE